MQANPPPDDKIMKGNNIKWSFYFFFAIHMLGFGGITVSITYFPEEWTPTPTYGNTLIFGGFALFIYSVFYVVTFKLEDLMSYVRDSLLGLYGVLSTISLLLSFFERSFWDYPLYYHILPTVYYIMYTFLFYQALLDIMRARDNEQKRKHATKVFTYGSLIIYTILFLWSVFRVNL